MRQPPLPRSPGTRPRRSQRPGRQAPAAALPRPSCLRQLPKPLPVPGAGPGVLPVATPRAEETVPPTTSWPLSWPSWQSSRPSQKTPGRVTGQGRGHPRAAQAQARSGKLGQAAGLWLAAAEEVVVAVLLLVDGSLRRLLSAQQSGALLCKLQATPRAVRSRQRGPLRRASPGPSLSGAAWPHLPPHGRPPAARAAPVRPASHEAALPRARRCLLMPARGKALPADPRHGPRAGWGETLAPLAAASPSTGGAAAPHCCARPRKPRAPARRGARRTTGWRARPFGRAGRHCTRADMAPWPARAIRAPTTHHPSAPRGAAVAPPQRVPPEPQPGERRCCTPPQSRRARESPMDLALPPHLLGRAPPTRL